MGHELDSPQQYGIWEVAGLGLVVAFRGTASAEDVFIDTNIEPVPLDATGGTRGNQHRQSSLRWPRRAFLLFTQ